MTTIVAYFKWVWSYKGPQGHPYCVRRLLELSKREGA